MKLQEYFENQVRRMVLRNEPGLNELELQHRISEEIKRFRLIYDPEKKKTESKIYI